MSTERSNRGVLLALLLLGSVATVVAGCSLATGKSITSKRPTAPAIALPTLTATAGSSPTVPAYLLPSAPLLPAGWSWYRDSIGHFQVPVAPGWGVGTFYSTLDQLHDCEYRIQFFPPGTSVTPGQPSATYAPRLIEIEVNLSCPPSSWSITPDQYTVQEPNPVMVDGQAVIVWDQDIPGEINHAADATFHGHQFGFEVQSRDSNFILVDVKVFLQMLHGFEYSGK
jgi:hypothetical protein